MWVPSALYSINNVLQCVKVLVLEEVRSQKTISNGKKRNISGSHSRSRDQETINIHQSTPHGCYYSQHEPTPTRHANRCSPVLFDRSAVFFGSRSKRRPLCPPLYLEWSSDDEVPRHKARECVRVLPGGHPPQRDTDQPGRSSVDEVVVVPAHVPSYRTIVFTAAAAADEQQRIRTTMRAGLEAPAMGVPMRPRTVQARLSESSYFDVRCCRKYLNS